MNTRRLQGIRRWAGVVALLALLLGGGSPMGHAAGDITFPQTGFTLSDAHGFLSYWQAHGGLAQFGYPISPEVVEVSPTNGRMYITQWFERNRFEYHPENPDPQYRVLLGLLGNDLTATRRTAREGAFARFPDAHYPNGRYFAETGHNLRNSFQTYWEQHGGLALYGYPISEEFEERSPTDGQTYVVQYFERNRFEWHPENKGTPYEVLLGLLGVQIGGFPVPAIPKAGTATPLVIPAAFAGEGKWKTAHQLTGPAGMHLSLFYTVDGARMLAVAPNGDIFVSATRSNRVWVLPDRNADGVADGRELFTDSVEKPHGLAFHKGYLYVAAEQAVYRFPYSPGQLHANGAGQKIADLPFGVGVGLAGDNNHDTRSITFGADGKMYISVGSDCDLCEETIPGRATIMQFNDDGSGGHVYAGGLRNAVGIDVDPRTGILWASVNERNKEGNDFPPELFTPIHENGDYGWPYCLGIPLVPDPLFHATAADCQAKDTAAVGLPAHMAPLGIRFYEGGGLLPKGYENGAFIAMHGSTLHDPVYGADVRFVSLRPGQLVQGAQLAISGWLVDGKYWGRPVDLAFGKDGALYISDDLGGALYRVTFNQ